MDARSFIKIAFTAFSLCVCGTVRAQWEQPVFIDDNYQPTISRTKAALLAYVIAKRLGIQDKWKVFEKLWMRNNMRNDYNDALYQQQTLKFQEKLKTIFAD